MITILSPAPVPRDINRLDLVDYMIVYESELKEITGINIEGGSNNEKIKGAYKFLVHSNSLNERKNPNLILIVCLGPNKGSLYVKNYIIVSIPAPKVKIIDKTLSRAAFVGAFVSEILQGNDLVNSLVYANAAMAFCSMNIGSISSLPSDRDVKQIIKDYPSY